MENEIKANLGNPEILEKLYRSDRKNFKTAFNNIYAEIETSEAAKSWKARLEYDNKTDTANLFSLQEIIAVAAIGLLAAFLI